jgi:hypothetical protein
MAAHAAFNGVIVVTAIALVSGPGHRVQLGDISYQLPAGWHQSSPQTVDGALHTVADGPTASALVFDERENPIGASPLDALTIISDVTSQNAGNSSTDSMQVSGARMIRTAGGELATADVTTEGHRGHLAAFVTSGNELWTVLGLVDGSGRGDRDWTTVLQSLRWPTGPSDTTASSVPA